MHNIRIQAAVVNQLLLEAIKEVCDYALNNETAFMEQERRRAKKAEYNRRYMEKKRRQWKEQRKS